MATATVTSLKLTDKDFQSDQEVRWCPGCGDYAILRQTQKVLADLDIPREKHVFVSGIGCSSRFPYYMNTYGFHTIHGRAPAFATGIKCVQPELTVWIATGDGDALSIGGNHLLHVLRRNVGVKILMFNNRIYGLTKGQYSPTSEFGKTTASTPMGAPDHPLNPLSLALGAEATFVARTLDRDLEHLGQTLHKAAAHEGTAFVEILQNCNVFNDGEWSAYTDKATKPFTTVKVEDGKPLIYGQNKDKGIRLGHLKLEAVDLAKGEAKPEDLLVADSSNLCLAEMLARISGKDGMPLPIGVLYKTHRPTYENDVVAQVAKARQDKGGGDLDQVLRAGETWVVS
jgi:2-oxoglutarate/2-oxoacid ferredoxin oxidoreductase subunit beta